jgi:hypothetical protein
LTVIKKGVQPGEEVVTRGHLQLSPGMKVAVQPAESPAPNEKKNGAGEISSGL